MSVNDLPLAPILRIFPGGNPADASTWGVGYDISDKIRYPGDNGGQAITYSGGRPDEATRVDSGQLTLTLDNTDGRFSTKNPLGTYYPLLRRGTPIVLSMLSGEDDFGRTSASDWGTSSSGVTWSTSGTASTWTVGSGVGSRVHATAGVIGIAELVDAGARHVRGHFTASTPATVTGAALISGAMVRRESTARFYFLSLEFNTAGTVTTKIWKYDSGTTELAALNPVPALTYSPGDRFTCWFESDGSELRVKVGPEADPEPEEWHATASDSSIQGTGVGLIFYRLLTNTNANAQMDFDDYHVEGIEFTGSVIKWPVNWDKSANLCWAPITAAGALRRLRQGSQPLRSPLAAQLSGYSHTGYWPLEDGSDATAFGSATSGVKAAAKSSTVSPASDTTLAGASTAPTFTASGAVISGSTLLRQSGTGFAAMFLAKLSALPASKTLVATWQGSGRITTWNIYIDATPSVTTEGVEADGTVTVNAVNLLVVDPRNWTAYQLEAETSGGTVSWAHTWHAVGETDYLSQFGTFASSSNHRVWAFQLGATASDLSGAAVSHVWIGENTLPFVTDSFSLVSDGYRGELAAARVQRLCDEAGIPIVVESGDSEPMGPQRIASRMDAIEACADADYGLLYEAGSGLGYRPRSARYNRAVSLELSVADRDIDEPPQPVDDDQRVRNDWTISRDQGASAQAIDQDHIDAEGHYPDSATINVETDDVLPGHAEWRLYLGTRDELRWPDLSLNFASRPSLIPAWRARPYGPRLTVDTGLSQVAGADPDVLTEGFTAQLWPYGWKVALNCSDARAWDVGVYDDGVARYDSASTVTDAEYAAGVTTIVFSTSDSGGLWSTTAEPYDVMIAGERCTVTSMGAASGSGPYTQTATVTRAVNGIAKTLPESSEIRIATPGRHAL